MKFAAGLPMFISGSRAADDCTSGFMSVDRMDDLLGNEGGIYLASFGSQVILPQVNFTCSGSILSWVFGAEWHGNTDFPIFFQVCH